MHWWISAALISFGTVMIVALTVQSFNSQRLVEHKIWRDLLVSVSSEHADLVRRGNVAGLPRTGVIRSWYWEGTTPAPDVPSYLVDLPAGYYSSEISFAQGAIESPESFHAMVVDVPPGRLVTAIDISELEAQQNRDALLVALFAGPLLLVFVVGAIAWHYANLVRPVRDLAARMQSLDPGVPTARLPTSYGREEIQVIARASNALLDRAERFLDRERSLLDQASHEFRTPVAVIAGAVDVLNQLSLPPSTKPAMSRIEHAVADLSETMVALLYLAREAAPGEAQAEVVHVDELVPRLVVDHEHLLQGKRTGLLVGTLEPTRVAAPESMVRIAVSNLLRNAIENTVAGHVEISLKCGVVSVTDSGQGFDPVEAARRYREALRHPTPARGQGLGLFLVGRICERFGWALTIDASSPGGTRALLDLGASVLKPYASRLIARGRG